MMELQCTPCLCETKLNWRKSLNEIFKIFGGDFRCYHTYVFLFLPDFKWHGICMSDPIEGIIHSLRVIMLQALSYGILTVLNHIFYGWYWTKVKVWVLNPYNCIYPIEGLSIELIKTCYVFIATHDCTVDIVVIIESNTLK